MADAPPAWVMILADTRLSREARIMGAFLAALGPGLHEVPHDTWRALLGGSRVGLTRDDTIAGYTSELVGLGWVTRAPGGRGHSPRYSFSPPAAGGLNEKIAPLLWGGLTDSLPQGGGYNPDSYPPGRGLSPPSFSPVSPVPPPDAQARVSQEAEAAIERADGALNGCRGSLRDYLAMRVDLDRQHAYVQRVVTALEGADEWMWRDRTGKTLTEGRTKLLAAALNELASGDETGKHFAEPPGGYGNLRSKVRYLVASSLGVDSDTTKAARPTPTTTPRRRTPSVHIEG